MARGWGQHPYTAVAVALAVGFAVAGHLLSGDGLFALLAVWLGIGGAGVLLRGYGARGWIGSALSTGAIGLFIGAAMFVAASIRNAPGDDGRWAILFLIAVTFATDTGAYLVGKAIGSHKMAPNVSPNKTWEGAAGGLLAASAAGAAFGWWMTDFQPIASDLIAGLAVGAVLGVAGQFGDLFESKLKRRAGTGRFGRHSAGAWGADG